MKLLLYGLYQEKKNNKKYSNLKKDLNRKEEKIRNVQNIDDISYKHISNNKKIFRFGEKLGGYRLVVYIYKDVALLVDFELKQKIEHEDNRYYDRIFENEEKYKEFIDKNYPKEQINEEDLSEYENFFNLEYKKMDMTLFEGKKFSKKIELKNEIELTSIFELMQQILENPFKLSKYNTIYKVENDKFKIYFKEMKEDYFVIDINNKENLKKYDKIDSDEEILKYASKAYPLEIFLEYDNKDEWISSIVKNRDGNIALSPEEEQILKSILDPYSDDKFPLFINGRAGSGKSTILQYLYAEYLVNFLNKEVDYNPIYLTYNEKLKEKAIEKVANIILAKKHLKEKLPTNTLDKNYIMELISTYFDSFEAKFEKSFLRKLLKEDIFENKEKIEFNEIIKFLANKLQKSDKKNITPELAWYVIRSFIKGRAKINDDRVVEFTPNDYENLFRKSKNIQNKTFEVIYNEIYPIYKKFLQENNLYDDLDLVIEVFKQKAFDKKFSVIFCDEAQDFTKLEFDLILNLNKLLDENVIHNIPSNKIPIAFAGDPFQTINPTGFSFEYLKALVFESYEHRNFTDVNLNYHELEYNYRSNGTIIQFSNLIQLTRGVLFDEEIKFQKNWLSKEDDDRSVFYLDIENKKIKECLIDNNSLYDIIAPFDTLQDMQNELDDNLLEDIIKYNKDKKFDTPIEVKGLEFQWVILYRFGDFYLKYYKEIEEFLIGFEEKEQSLPYEYFFNNLYVGITRPKEKLFIVDSKDALNNFWEKIDINNLFEKYQQKKKTFNEKKEHLYHIDEGSCKDFNNENSYQLAQERLKQILFERIDSINNPKLETYIKDVENILLKNENIVNKDIYQSISNGYEHIIKKNFIKALNYFKKVINSKKLSNSENNFLKKISFSILWDNFDKTFCKKINNYDIFILGKKEEVLFKIIKLFCEEKYEELTVLVIEKSIVSNKRLKYFIQESVNKFKDKYVISDLYENKYLDSKELIELVKYFKDKDLEYALSIFNIDENLKKENKELYCDLFLQKEPKNVDCLFIKSNYQKIIDIIKENDIALSNEQIKTLLYYINKNMEFIEGLDYIDTKNIIDVYKEIINNENIYPNIFKYILQKVFIETKNSNLFPEVMKIFNKETKKLNKKLLEIFINEVIEEIDKDTKEMRNSFLFSALLTHINDFYRELKICDIITLLEKTMEYENPKNIDYLLGFYRYYLRNKSQQKFKYLIAARYIKIMYEFDKKNKDEFNKNPRRFRKNSYFDYIMNKIKFLKPNVDENLLKNSSLFINRKDCENLVNVKSVERILNILSKEIEEKEDDIKEIVISDITENIKQENENKIIKEQPEKMENKTESKEIQFQNHHDVLRILYEVEIFVENNFKFIDEKGKRSLKRILRSLLQLTEE